MKQVSANKTQGLQFEQIFERVSRLQGFAVRKVPTSGEWNWRGTFLPVDSELDYIIVSPDERVAFVDTKCFQAESFEFSQLETHQIDTACWFNYVGVAAGFVVWFKSVNRVVFFTGQQILDKGPCSSFKWNEGVVLGTFENFDLWSLLK